MEQPFTCTDCRYRSVVAGECPKGCGPLLDFRIDDVRAAVVEDDDRRVEAQKQQNHVVGVVVGVLAVGLSLWSDVMRRAILDVPMPVPFGNPLKFLLVGILSAGVLAYGLDRGRPSPRIFPELK